jgi:hypothetical protein
VADFNTDIITTETHVQKKALVFSFENVRIAHVQLLKTTTSKKKEIIHSRSILTAIIVNFYPISPFNSSSL